MAFANRNVTVNTTGKRLNIDETDNDYGLTLVIKVPSGGSTIFLGPKGVTADAGFPIEAGTTLSIDLKRDEPLYAVVESGTQLVYVLAEGV